ncbi:MAG: hypothetical protein QOG22_204 [Pseudonocardiales bacterium]|nr:hypothetical protein [Pseudonocardiales bacterium]
MKHVQERPTTQTPQRDQPKEGVVHVPAQVPLWQLNLLRAGYLVMGGGLAVVKWPLLFTHGPWELKQGTVECMLVAMSLLALLGLRYPLRMLPILLFEVSWKLIWLSVVALPLWTDDKLAGDTRAQAGTVLWVVLIIAVIPWRYVLATYVTAPGDPLHRRR